MMLDHWVNIYIMLLYMYVGDRFENFCSEDHKRSFLFQESSLFAVTAELIKSWIVRDLGEGKN